MLRWIGRKLMKGMKRKGKTRRKSWIGCKGYLWVDKEEQVGHAKEGEKD